MTAIVVFAAALIGLMLGARAFHAARQHPKGKRRVRVRRIEYYF